MFVNRSGRNVPSLQRTLHRYYLSSVGTFGQAVSEEKIFQKSTNQKQELPLVAMFVNQSGRNEHSLKRTIHKCFQPCFNSFGFSVSEETNFQKSTNQKQELSVLAMFINGSGQNMQSLQRTFHRYYLPSFGTFSQAVSEEKIFQKSTNQKQELPLVAMFVNGSGRNEQALQRTFHK